MITARVIGDVIVIVRVNTTIICNQSYSVGRIRTGVTIEILRRNSAVTNGFKGIVYIMI
jgi:hypothetical protein